MRLQPGQEGLQGHYRDHHEGRAELRRQPRAAAGHREEALPGRWRVSVPSPAIQHEEMLLEAEVNSALGFPKCYHTCGLTRAICHGLKQLRSAVGYSSSRLHYADCL